MQALQQQLLVLEAAVPGERPPAFAMKAEPGFCSESDVLRQRAALLAAEDASVSAATASVHTWTVEQHEQLKAMHEELPLAGNTMLHTPRARIVIAVSHTHRSPCVHYSAHCRY